MSTFTFVINAREINPNKMNHLPIDLSFLALKTHIMNYLSEHHRKQRLDITGIEFATRILSDNGDVALQITVETNSGEYDRYIKDKISSYLKQ